MTDQQVIDFLFWIEYNCTKHGEYYYCLINSQYYLTNSLVHFYKTEILKL